MSPTLSKQPKAKSSAEGFVPPIKGEDNLQIKKLNEIQIHL